ncbi:unnamed protein product, partial [Rotaria sordida]
MSDYLVNGFKIFLLELPDLPTEALKNVIRHCEDLDQLRADLQRYPNSTKVIVCKSNHLIGVDELLMNHLIDTLYVLVNQEDQDIQECRKFVFRQELIRRHLASHSRFYDYSAGICNITDNLPRERPRILVNISELLIKLREQIVPYPEEYFEGRGIVLTVGFAQASSEKVTLK